jgi:hypothetical protein
MSTAAPQHLPSTTSTEESGTDRDSEPETKRRRSRAYATQYSNDEFEEMQDTVNSLLARMRSLEREIKIVSETLKRMVSSRRGVATAARQPAGLH